MVLINLYSFQDQSRNHLISDTLEDFIRNTISALGLRSCNNFKMFRFTKMSTFSYTKYPSLVVNSINGLNVFFPCFCSSNLHFMTSERREREKNELFMYYLLITTSFRLLCRQKKKEYSCKKKKIVSTYSRLSKCIKRLFRLVSLTMAFNNSLFSSLSHSTVTVLLSSKYIFNVVLITSILGWSTLECVSDGTLSKV